MGSTPTLAHHPPQQEPTTPTTEAAERLGPRAAEQAFDRLNPGFGVPADTRDPLGRQAVRDREAALALGTRVAVASSRENDRDPVVWLAGQDYRAADAVRRARTQPTRTRHGRERAGAER
jgi:hypothetical protein